MRGWLRPFVFFSSNWLSLVGVILVTTAGVLWIFLLPTLWKGSTDNPYLGILIFLMLPMVFFAGLAIIPVGIWLRAKKARKEGKYPDSFPPLDFTNPELRRLLLFIALTTGANLVIGAQSSYTAVTYMDSVEFCGKTCHKVMQPEYTAYQNSPHSRVECVKCHIGPGASWFVKSKLSGAWQVVSVTFGLYPKPIPAPVENLRPARETCEACHWPQKFGGDRLRVIPKFGEDEKNTRTDTVLLMHVGGGNTFGPGIHGVHLGPGITIRYAHADRERQQIPWVEYSNGRESPIAYTAEGAKAEDIAKMTVRVMDCMDCHNRPSHTYQMPERAVDQALAAGVISSELPFVRKRAVEILKSAKSAEDINSQFASFYGTSNGAQKDHASRALVDIWSRNVFPAMNVNWGSYPNNIGHTDFPGCFRCHDESHSAPGGKKITQDCASCHGLLAVDEASPKILSDLGVTR
jgi:hypothetical protein